MSVPSRTAGTASRRADPAGRVRRLLCSTVLVSEALVIVFAMLVAKDLTDVSTRALMSVGGGGALACLLLSGLLRRRWAYVAGSLLQVLLVLSGLVVPTMFLLGAVFAALWFLSLYLAVRVGRTQSAFARKSSPNTPTDAPAPTSAE